MEIELTEPRPDAASSHAKSMVAIHRIDQLMDEISLLRLAVRNATCYKPTGEIPAEGTGKGNVVVERFHHVDEIRRNIARLSASLLVATQQLDES
ncbi:hypothetical protein SeMB42_g06704 [Synchytrium endobioticum]|uniref:Uncharacterized protein n=1 Tax=Synchytrium endobioticum TaxID=286115 RepID=A0A507CAA8_9FUNG|nr:hypothetical protein SeMB42_g06704 [Synchytrium endobioticum]